MANLSSTDIIIKLVECYMIDYTTSTENGHREDNTAFLFSIQRASSKILLTLLERVQSSREA